MADDLPIRDGVVIPGEELELLFSRSGGPGGQNVNRVRTRVQLRFDLAQTRSLSAAVRSRLAQMAGRRLSSEGVLVLSSDRHRTQARNIEDVRERLQAMVLQALTPPKTRRKTRVPRAARRRRLDNKRRRSEVKQRRRKPSGD